MTATETANDRKRAPRSLGYVVGWLVVVIFVIYPLSIFPAAIAGAWLEHWGIVDLNEPFNVFYWPVVTVVDATEAGGQVGRFLSSLFDSVMPPH